MAGYNDSGIRTFTSGGVIPAHARVKLSGATVVVAVADEACIGLSERAVASGEEVAIRMINHQGTFLAIAGGIVAVGADLEGDAGGKLITQDSGTTRFTALTAGAGDGSIIEVLPITLA